MRHYIDPAALAVLTDIAATVEFFSWPDSRAAGPDLASIAMKFVKATGLGRSEQVALFDTVTAILACEVGNPYTWGTDKAPIAVSNAIFDAIERINLELELSA